MPKNNRKRKSQQQRNNNNNTNALKRNKQNKQQQQQSNEAAKGPQQHGKSNENAIDTVGCSPTCSNNVPRQDETAGEQGLDVLVEEQGITGAPIATTTKLEFKTNSIQYDESEFGDKINSTKTEELSTNQRDDFVNISDDSKPIEEQRSNEVELVCLIENNSNRTGANTSSELGVGEELKADGQPKQAPSTTLSSGGSAIVELKTIVKSVYIDHNSGDIDNKSVDIDDKKSEIDKKTIEIDKKSFDDVQTIIEEADKKVESIEILNKPVEIDKQSIPEEQLYALSSSTSIESDILDNDGNLNVETKLNDTKNLPDKQIINSTSSSSIENNENVIIRNDITEHIESSCVLDDCDSSNLTICDNENANSNAFSNNSDEQNSRLPRKSPSKSPSPARSTSSSSTLCDDKNDADRNIDVVDGDVTSPQLPSSADRNVTTTTTFTATVNQFPLKHCVVQEIIQTRCSYRVESPKPTVIKTTTTVKKSRSLDDDVFAIQELSDASSSSELNDNQPVVSEASESEAESETNETYEIYQHPNIVSVQTIPIDEDDLEDDVLNEEDDAKTRRAKKRIAIETHFMPQFLNPRYLDSIKEESTSDTSDIERKSNDSCDNIQLNKRISVDSVDDLEDDVFHPAIPTTPPGSDQSPGKADAVFPKSNLDFSQKKRHHTSLLPHPKTSIIREEPTCIVLEAKIIEQGSIEESCSTWKTDKIPECDAAEVVYIDSASSSSSDIVDLDELDMENMIEDQNVRIQTPTIDVNEVDNLLKNSVTSSSTQADKDDNHEDINIPIITTSMMSSVTTTTTTKQTKEISTLENENQNELKSNITPPVSREAEDDRKDQNNQNDRDENRKKLDQNQGHEKHDDDDDEECAKNYEINLANENNSAVSEESIPKEISVITSSSTDQEIESTNKSSESSSILIKTTTIKIELKNIDNNDNNLVESELLCNNNNENKNILNTHNVDDIDDKLNNNSAIIDDNNIITESDNRNNNNNNNCDQNQENISVNSSDSNNNNNCNNNNMFASLLSPLISSQDELIKKISEESTNNNNNNKEFTRQDSSGSLCSGHSQNTVINKETTPNDLAEFDVGQYPISGSSPNRVSPSKTTDRTAGGSDTSLRSLRQLCLDTLASMPYGYAVLEELASVSETINDLTQQHQQLQLQREDETGEMPYPLPELPQINDLEVRMHENDAKTYARSSSASKLSQVRLVTLPPPVPPLAKLKSPPPPPIPEQPKMDSWLGVPTEQDPNVLVCLSPSQRSYMNETKKTAVTDTSADNLLDMHKKFIERRGYHEYTTEQVNSIQKQKQDKHLSISTTSQSSTGAAAPLLPSATTNVTSVMELRNYRSPSPPPIPPPPLPRSLVPPNEIINTTNLSSIAATTATTTTTTVTSTQTSKSDDKNNHRLLAIIRDSKQPLSENIPKEIQHKIVVEKSQFDFLSKDEHQKNHNIQETIQPERTSATTTVSATSKVSQPPPPPPVKSSEPKTKIVPLSTLAEIEAQLLSISKIAETKNIEEKTEIKSEIKTEKSTDMPSRFDFFANKDPGKDKLFSSFNDLKTRCEGYENELSKRYSNIETISSSSPSSPFCSQIMQTIPKRYSNVEKSSFESKKRIENGKVVYDYTDSQKEKIIDDGKGGIISESTNNRTNEAPKMQSESQSKPQSQSQQEQKPSQQEQPKQQRKPQEQTSADYFSQSFKNRKFDNEKKIHTESASSSSGRPSSMFSSLPRLGKQPTQTHAQDPNNFAYDEFRERAKESAQRRAKSEFFDREIFNFKDFDDTKNRFFDDDFFRSFNADKSKKKENLQKEFTIPIKIEIQKQSKNEYESKKTTAENLEHKEHTIPIQVEGREQHPRQDFPPNFSPQHHDQNLTEKRLSSQNLDEWMKYTTSPLATVANDLGASSENITKPIQKEFDVCRGRRTNIRAPRLSASTNNLSEFDSHDESSTSMYHSNFYSPAMKRRQYNSMYEQPTTPSPTTNGPQFARRGSLPQERQLDYIKMKEQELQAEFDKLEFDRRRLIEEMDRMHTNHRMRKDSYTQRSSTHRLPTLNEEETIRQQLQNEWLNKVAEREERRLQNIIKISKPINELPQTAPGVENHNYTDNMKKAASTTDISDEFLRRVKERRSKLCMPSDSDWESGAESQPQPSQFDEHNKVNNSEPPRVKVIEGHQEADFKHLPKHLREFAEFTNSLQEEHNEKTSMYKESSMIHSKDGVWTPHGKSESKSTENKRITTKQTPSTPPPPPPPPPVWSPQPSPQLGRKEFRPVHFESPTPTRKYIQRQESAPAAPPWSYTAEPNKPFSSSCTSLNTFGYDSRPLKTTSSTSISSLQKAREGQIQKGTSYTELNRPKIPKDDTPAFVRPNEVSRYPYRTNGYMSEPEPNYDSDYSTTMKYNTLDRRRIPSTGSYDDRSYGTMPNPIKSGSGSYKNQPGKIEDYMPGRSSISEKEKKEWWDEVMEIFNGHLEQQKLSNNYAEGYLSRALKEQGYESDSHLVFRKKEESQIAPLSPVEQRYAYRSVQAGGEPPFQGFRKLAPEKPKETDVVPPPPPIKGIPLNGINGQSPESPRRYIESDVNIHYKSPVRYEFKEAIPEEELARRQAEAMKKLYQEERRRKYLQELQDMNSRRHTDNFTPTQKSPIPLNRYDDFSTDIISPKSPNTFTYPRTIARALYNFQGQTARELTFKKGDVIYIRRQIDKNWFEGEHNAMVGLLPANYVEIVTRDGARQAPPRKPSEGQARAKFNFSAQSAIELSLNKGELVILTRRVDENWFEGKIANRKGIFPVSYVDVLTDIGTEDFGQMATNKPVGTPASHSLITFSNQNPSLEALRTNLNTELSNLTNGHHNQSNGILRESKSVHKTEVLHVDTNSEPIAYVSDDNIYRALYKYRPQNNDELELQEGDIVYVLEKCDDGWYVGTSQRTGYFGTFPGNYVERI